MSFIFSGGCALNCEWNSGWIKSGLFSDVFIQPCANDSGSAIGTAVDAMLFYTGNAKIEWTVYSGEEPVHDDLEEKDYFEVSDFNPSDVAQYLKNDIVLGWVKGKYEIGPRALGARSILASPINKKMLDKLNQIKRREEFRPIAPMCLEEDMGKYFEPSTPSPFMLQFRNVISDHIPAVTHVDRSARPQSVSLKETPDLYETMLEFKKITGVSVLCNTSLNFNGFGFINRLSDMGRFAIKHGLDGFVFENHIFLKKNNKKELL
ncbi:carbamoyltransferase C-terminal domain-containing protein [Endozoicomonas acroporae]|uniref:carbamoyltransferase C-terminal domain-containing protein n=1 Tax=Endozoicomonas acroporae TaxID=1701104 RepID=UPI003D79DC9A